jgi:hypothetical protein
MEKSNTPPASPKEKNLGLLGACGIASLAEHIVYAYIGLSPFFT